jgi:hypothetical protein
VPGLGVTLAPDSIEALEAEPDRIDEPMAARAGLHRRVGRVALAGGERRIDRRRLHHQARGRRRQRLAEEALAHQLAAVDRR